MESLRVSADGMMMMIISPFGQLADGIIEGLC
jgi:hypothetical protein